MTLYTPYIEARCADDTRTTALSSQVKAGKANCDWTATSLVDNKRHLSTTNSISSPSMKLSTVKGGNLARRLQLLSRPTDRKFILWVKHLHSVDTELAGFPFFSPPFFSI